MKTIFVSLYDGDTEKVIMHTGVVAQLVERGHRVVLLVRGPDRLAYYQNAYGGPQVVIELSPPSRSWGELLWHEISWNSVPARGAYIRQRIAYARSGKLVPYLMRRFFSLLAGIRVWREFLRLLYRLSPDEYAADLFEKYTPALLFAPNMFSPSDFRLLRAAKRRGIPTATMVKSWDVLTTKAFTRVKADRIFAPNERTKEEAVRYGDYAPTAVVITGFPQYDIYVRTSERVSREAFCKKLNLDPTKRLILFAVPGDSFAPHTNEILSLLDQKVSEGAFPCPLQILARLHPKYQSASTALHLANGVFDRPGTLLGDSARVIESGGDLFSWTFTRADVEHLADSLFHADAVVATFSTMVLDALASDTPTVLIGYDGDHPVPYWHSIRRQYDREYYAYALSFGATPLVTSHTELIDALTTFLNDHEHLREARNRMRRTLLGADRGRAASHMANAIIEML